jgi:hypothetical protein
MCASGKEHNQTSDESLDAIAKNQSELGTGLFLTLDPVSGGDQHQVAIEPGLSYDDCLVRGAQHHAFKWVADSDMSHAEIQNSRFGCSNFDCRDGKRCPTGCLCLSGTKNCV